MIKRNKGFLILLMTMTLLLIFLGLYFVNNYNKCIFYSFSGRSKNIEIGGIAYVRNNYSIFKVFNKRQYSKISLEPEDIYISDISIEFISNGKSLLKIGTYDGDIKVDSNKELFSLKSYLDTNEIDSDMFNDSDFKLNYKFDNNLKAKIQYVNDNKIKTEIIVFDVIKLANNKLIYN